VLASAKGDEYRLVQSSSTCGRICMHERAETDQTTHGNYTVSCCRHGNFAKRALRKVQQGRVLIIWDMKSK
jgi:hypothetical protein